MRYAQSGWHRYATTSPVPTIMLEGKGAGAIYSNAYWDKLDEEADAILATARKIAAQKSPL